MHLRSLLLSLEQSCVHCIHWGRKHCFVKLLCGVLWELVLWSYEVFKFKKKQKKTGINKEDYKTYFQVWLPASRIKVHEWELVNSTFCTDAFSTHFYFSPKLLVSKLAYQGLECPWNVHSLWTVYNAEWQCGFYFVFILYILIPGWN